MWKGLMTEELEQLFLQYADQHNGAEPDEYEDIDYDDISYEEFVCYIRKCLETGLAIPDVIEAADSQPFYARCCQMPFVRSFLAAIFRKLNW